MKVPNKTYLVGGAVRDRLLGNTPTERDWVVVGSDEATLLASGYRKVGDKFPVFLHPITREEFALARTERKNAVGHTGFEVDCSPDVTLDQDLSRRDFTINAMAMDESRSLIDPFGGRDDLDDRVLRHVSSAFVDDPLRCFRAARFCAQLPEFRVHDSTKALISSMADSLAELSAERVWQEFDKSLQCLRPAQFFRTIAECRITQPWFNEIDCHNTAEQIAKHALQGNPIHAMIGWIHDPTAIQSFYQHLKAPRVPRNLASISSQYGRVLVQPGAQTAENLFTALEKSLAWQHRQLFSQMVADLSAFADIPKNQIQTLLNQLDELKVSVKEGIGYGSALKQKRIEVIEDWQKNTAK